jgi:hypothetical protein
MSPVTVMMIMMERYIKYYCHGKENNNYHKILSFCPTCDSKDYCLMWLVDWSYSCPTDRYVHSSCQGNGVPHWYESGA